MINSGPATHGPIRLVDLYKIAKQYADKPIKVSVGAGPVNLAWHVYFQHYKDPQELCYALAPIFNAEMKGLVEAGATYLQLEDLGAWLPLFTGDEDDYEWIRDVIGKCCEGVDAKIGWHFCFGNAWGNDILSPNFPEGYQTVLPHFFDTPGIDQFVLDYANRDMDGIEFLADLPADKDVQVGVLDIRTMMVESPEQVAGRARKVLEHVPADRVTLSTDCGMKPLPRTGREDEAEGPRRGRRDRAGRAVGRHRAWGGALSRALTPRACIEGCEGGMRGHGCRRLQDAACAGGSANSSPFVHHVSSA